VTCPVCGGERTYSPKDGKWKCETCLHTWFLLQQSYVEGFHVSNETWRHKDMVRRQSFIDTRKKMVLDALGGMPESILDVGCGDCAFLDSFRGIKTRVGIECNENAFPVDGIEHVRGFFPECCPEAMFDVVTSFHSLEHIVDCVGALRCMIEHSKRVVAIEVPVFRQLWSFSESGDGHVQAFSVKSFLVMIEKHAKEMKTVGWKRKVQGSSALWIGVRK
jgi:hypothetical protein